jgi:hypothetical protein
VIVVTGTAGAEVRGTAAVLVMIPVAAATDEGATVGIRVIVDGMAVTMPGF